MPTPIVPSSGLISMSNNIEPAFANKLGGSISAYAGMHPSLPAKGQVIGLNSFRGLTAVTPSLTLAAVTGSSNISVDATGNFNGSVSSNQVGALTYDMSAFVTNSAYGGSHTYSVTTGTLPAGASLNGSTGVLTLSSVTAATAGSVTVTVTNAYGNSRTQILTFNLLSAVPTPTAVGTIPNYVGLSNVPMKLNLAPYFTNATLYSATTPTYQSALSISGSNLTVTPAWRYNTYTVSVAGSNVSGKASQSFTVNETTNKPVLISSIGNIGNLNKDWQQLDVRGYFLNGAAASYTYTSTGNHYSGHLDIKTNNTYQPWYDITYTSWSDAYWLIINPFFRNATYTLTVTASNANGSASTSFTTQENAPPAAPGCTNTSFGSVLGYGGPSYSFDLSSHFNGQVTGYGVSGGTNYQVNGTTFTVTTSLAGWANPYALSVYAINAANIYSSSAAVLNVHEFDYGEFIIDMWLNNWTNNGTSVSIEFEWWSDGNPQNQYVAGNMSFVNYINTRSLQYFFFAGLGIRMNNPKITNQKIVAPGSAEYTYTVTFNCLDSASAQNPPNGLTGLQIHWIP